MNKEDLIIGVHGDGKLTGGHYNILAGFSRGLLNGFRNIGVKAFSTKECFESNIKPNLVIGFNASGFETWAEYLKHDITNIMWNIDSVFFQNFEAVNQFYQHPNFYLFNISPADNEPLSKFFPELKHTYIPSAVDLGLWKKKDVEKDIDVVFLSSIFDYEAKIEELKNSLAPVVFELLMMMYETWMAAPTISFWELYSIFNKESGLVFDINQYYFMFKNLAYLVSFAKRAQMIEKLQDFNVKVYGSGPWEKYVKGKVQYMGECDLLQSVDVMNRSKIVLHSHPAQLSAGLHDRILNASAVESFVLSSNTKSIENEFKDSMGYYNLADFADLQTNLEHYLKDDEERISMTKIANQITVNHHSWEERAKLILTLLT